MDHFAVLFLILSTVEVKRSFFLLPKCSGKPRYFPVPPFYISRISIVASFIGAEVLEEKVIDDLLLFIFCPKASSYSRRMSFSAWQDSGVA